MEMFPFISGIFPVLQKIDGPELGASGFFLPLYVVYDHVIWVLHYSNKTKEADEKKSRDWFSYPFRNSPASI